VNEKRVTRRHTFTLFELLAITVPAGLLCFCCILPVFSAREAARRSQCKGNLFFIRYALEYYHDRYGSLPPAYTVDAQGKPLHSWRTLLLPYMDQTPLYQAIDLTKPWDHPVNAAAFKTGILGYRCPTAGLPENHTTYLAVVGPNAAFYRNKSRKLTEITDDRSNTFILIEAPADKSVPWMAPIDADEALVLSIGVTSRPVHNGSVHVATGEGRVRPLKANVPAAARRAAISIAGKDNDRTQDLWEHVE